MSQRIAQGYRTQLKEMLTIGGWRAPALLAERLIGRTLRSTHADAIEEDRAYRGLLQRVRTRVVARLACDGRSLLGARLDLCRQRGALLAATTHEGLLRTPVFLCDEGLGALARWLRAAGYEADWFQGGSDGELTRRAVRAGRILVSADSRLWEEVPDIRAGRWPAVWVSSRLGRTEQLAVLLADLALGLRAPRCMPCGGELRAVEKQSVHERIPPRTAAWRDEYFVCTRCGRLFWRGTHWEKIQARMIRGDYA
ncbi:MAG: Mut7-C RNAse domain-containing protein [Vicinamibacteria bacterium]|jgi:hypothetical protein|nr:Mut7-C RNAse domain-containing protein [Vicinamibacteria bacterium]